MPAESLVGSGGMGRVLRVVAAAGALAGVPAILSACGGSAAAGAAGPVEVYVRALADGDGEKACAQFSGTYKREFLSSYMEGFPEIGATTCGEVVMKVNAMLGADEVAMLRDAEVEAEVDGDRASVTIAGGTNTASMQRIDGQWLIVGGMNFQSPE